MGMAGNNIRSVVCDTVANHFLAPVSDLRTRYSCEIRNPVPLNAGFPGSLLSLERRNVARQIGQEFWQSVYFNSMYRVNHGD
jgi:hypothetical protein